jgi:hypothetical protein
MTPDPAETLRSLLDSLPAAAPKAPPLLRTSSGEPCGDPVLSALVLSFAVWETGEDAGADLALRLTRAFVDLNDLRVSRAEELAEVLGQGDALALERSRRLIASLNDIFEREQAVDLSGLLQHTKKESRSYLESLREIPPFVALRTALLGLGAHAVPLDHRLGSRLLAAGALPAENPSAWIERQIRAAESRECYWRLDAWAAARPDLPEAAPTPGSSPAAPVHNPQD